MCLYHNLQECVETDSALFYRLLPLVYKQFLRDLSTNHEMLNTAVANIDPAQVGGLLISIPNMCGDWTDIFYSMIVVVYSLSSWV